MGRIGAVAILVLLAACTSSGSRTVETLATTAAVACQEAHMPELLVDGQPGPVPATWADAICPKNGGGFDSLRNDLVAASRKASRRTS